MENRTENFRNLVPNPSAEEKTTWNSVLWNKNRSNSGNSIPRSLLRKKKQVRIPFRGTRIEANFQIAVPNHSAEGKTTQKKRQLKIVTLWRILPHWKYCWVFSTYY
jgi:hypothetical protein